MTLNCSVTEPRIWSSSMQYWIHLFTHQWHWRITSHLPRYITVLVTNVWRSCIGSPRDWHISQTLAALTEALFQQRTPSKFSRTVKLLTESYIQNTPLLFTLKPNIYPNILHPHLTIRSYWLSIYLIYSQFINILCQLQAFQLCESSQIFIANLQSMQINYWL